jgi:amphi-Trp domain-containing protein
MTKKGERTHKKEASHKEKFKVRGTAGMQEIIHQLEGLLHGMKTGKIQMRQADMEMEFVPAEIAKFEIEAEVKDGKRELSIELKWKPDLKEGEKLDFTFFTNRPEESFFPEELKSLCEQDFAPCADLEEEHKLRMALSDERAAPGVFIPEHKGIEHAFEATFGAPPNRGVQKAEMSASTEEHSPGGV